MPLDTSRGCSSPSRVLPQKVRTPPSSPNIRGRAETALPGVEAPTSAAPLPPALAAPRSPVAPEPGKRPTPFVTYRRGGGILRSPESQARGSTPPCRRPADHAREDL